MGNAGLLEKFILNMAEVRMQLYALNDVQLRRSCRSRHKLNQGVTIILTV